MLNQNEKQQASLVVVGLEAIIEGLKLTPEAYYNVELFVSMRAALLEGYNNSAIYFFHNMLETAERELLGDLAREDVEFKAASAEVLKIEWLF